MKKGGGGGGVEWGGGEGGGGEGVIFGGLKAKTILVEEKISLPAL